MTDPMEAIDKLAKRVAETAQAEGLRMVRLAAVAGDPPHLEAMFALDPDYQPPSEHDDMLAGIAEATRLAEIERKAEEARKGLVDLEEQLKRPENGIL